MKRILFLTPICLITIIILGNFVINEPALAKKRKKDRTITKICYPQTFTDVEQSSANHPTAYADGYREGQNNRLSGQPYQPRNAGGEFARGFDDGYYNRPYTGQRYIVPDTVNSYTTMNCQYE